MVKLKIFKLALFAWVLVEILAPRERETAWTQMSSYAGHAHFPRPAVSRPASPPACQACLTNGTNEISASFLIIWHERKGRELGTLIIIKPRIGSWFF